MWWISVFDSTKPPISLAVRSSTQLIITTVGVAIFTDLFLYGIIVPVVPFALHSKAGIAEDQVQRWISILLAVYGAAVLVASPATGYLADHISSRQIPLLIGLVALGGSTAILCAASNIAMFIVGRIFQGVSAAVVWSVGLALLVDTVNPEEVGRMLGYMSIAMGLGLLLAPLLAGIVFEKGGYYAVFAMAFALLAIDITLRLCIIEKKIAARWLPDRNTRHSRGGTCILPGAPSLDEEKIDGRTEPVLQGIVAQPSNSAGHSDRLPHFHIVLSSPRILASLWGVLAVSALLTAFDSVLPLFVSETFQWSSLNAGLIFLPLALPSFLSPIIGYCADRWGSRWISTAGFVFAVPFFVVLRFVTYNSTSQVVLLCALLILISLAMNLTMTPLMAEMTYALVAIEHDKPGVFGKKGAYAQTYSLFNVAFAGGSLAGPILAGLIKDSVGWATMAWTLAVVSCFGAVTSVIWIGPARSRS